MYLILFVTANEWQSSYQGPSIIETDRMMILEEPRDTTELMETSSPTAAGAGARLAVVEGTVRAGSVDKYPRGI